MAALDLNTLKDVLPSLSHCMCSASRSRKCQCNYQSLLWPFSKSSQLVGCEEEAWLPVKPRDRRRQNSRKHADATCAAPLNLELLCCTRIFKDWRGWQLKLKLARWKIFVKTMFSYEWKQRPLGLMYNSLFSFFLCYFQQCDGAIFFFKDISHSSLYLLHHSQPACLALFIYPPNNIAWL